MEMWRTTTMSLARSITLWTGTSKSILRLSNQIEWARLKKLNFLQLPPMTIFFLSQQNDRLTKDDLTKTEVNSVER